MKDKYQKLFLLIREEGYEIKHTSLIENKLNLVVKVNDVNEFQKVESLVGRVNKPGESDIDLQIIY